MTPKATSAPYCVGINVHAKRELTKALSPGEIFLPQARLHKNTSLAIRPGQVSERLGCMLTDLPRVADHSGVANFCATSRESQVSYAVDIELPIAAFSSGDASHYSYCYATLKSCCISSGVGGAGGLFGSNGRASSRKKL
jgi:hypothetical protein